VKYRPSGNPIQNLTLEELLGNQNGQL